MTLDHPIGAGEYIPFVDHPLPWLVAGMVGILLAILFFNWMAGRGEPPVVTRAVTELLARYRLALVRGNTFGGHANDAEIALVDAAIAREPKS